MFRVGDVLKGITDPLGRNPYSFTSENSIVVVEGIEGSELVVRVRKSGDRSQGYDGTGLTFPVESRFFILHAINKGREENV